MSLGRIGSDKDILRHFSLIGSIEEVNSGVNVSVTRHKLVFKELYIVFELG
jgi:hypothetical protein